MRKGQPASDGPEGLLTVTEFCRRFGCGRTRAFELMASGKLKARMFGAKNLIELESALAWAASLPRRKVENIARAEA